MINLYRNKQGIKGAATLITTVVLFLLITLLMFFAANYNISQQKTAANSYRYNQAYEAAEAGMEFAINYLKQNRTTIVATASGGYINYSDSSTTNVSLGNGSSFTVLYTNPTANNYDLIQITSTGIGNDATSTRVIRQQVQYGSLLADIPDFPVITKGDVALSGNATITNMSQEKTIQASGDISFSGNGMTVTQSGPDQGGPDVQGNVASIESMSVNDLLASYLGASGSVVKNNFPNYYSNSSTTDYSSTLNGMSGTAIWIDQTGGAARISGNTVIGSASAPVLLVVNGDFDISGNVTIYGFVFVLGTTSAETSITGNVNVTGGLISGDNLNIAGNVGLTFNQTVLDNLQDLTSLSYYAKVPGSWKDF